MWAGLRLKATSGGGAQRLLLSSSPSPPAPLPGFIHLIFFFHEGSEAWLKAMESVLPAAGFLYWVGASTVVCLVLRISCLLFTAVRVWGLGNESGVGPRLGEWAGE